MADSNKFQGLPGVSCEGFLEYLKPNGEEIERCRRKGTFNLGVISANGNHDALLSYSPKSMTPIHMFLDQADVVKKRLLYGLNLINLNGVDAEIEDFRSLLTDVFSGDSLVTGTDVQFSANPKMKSYNDGLLFVKYKKDQIVAQKIHRVFKKHLKPKNPQRTPPSSLYNPNFEELQKMLKDDSYLAVHMLECQNIDDGCLYLFNKILGSQITANSPQVDDALGQVVAPHRVPPPYYYNDLKENPMTNLSTPLGNLNRFLYEMIGNETGITSPSLYLGMKSSAFVLRREKFSSLNSVSYQVFGESKRMYIIPPRFVSRLEAMVLENVAKTFPNAPKCLLMHKEVKITTTQLDAWEIGYYEVVQTTGTLVVTSWSSYRMGYCEGENCCLSMNTVLADWKMFSQREATTCQCGRYNSSTAKKKLTPNLEASSQQPTNDISSIGKLYGLQLQRNETVHEFNENQIKFGQLCYEKKYFCISGYWLLDEFSMNEFIDGVNSYFPPTNSASISQIEVTLKEESGKENQDQLNLRLFQERDNDNHQSEFGVPFSQPPDPTPQSVVHTFLQITTLPFANYPESYIQVKPTDTIADILRFVQNGSDQQKSILKIVNETQSTGDVNYRINQSLLPNERSQQIILNLDTNSITLEDVAALDTPAEESVGLLTHFNQLQAITSPIEIILVDETVANALALSQVGQSLQPDPDIVDNAKQSTLNPGPTTESNLDPLPQTNKQHGHILLSDGTTKLECLCGQKFKYLSVLNEHVARATTAKTDKNVPCKQEGCNKMFRTLTCMQQHLRRIHKNTNKVKKRRSKVKKANL